MFGPPQVPCTPITPRKTSMSLASVSKEINTDQRHHRHNTDPHSFPAGISRLPHPAIRSLLVDGYHPAFSTHFLHPSNISHILSLEPPEVRMGRHTAPTPYDIVPYRTPIPCMRLYRIFLPFYDAYQVRRPYLTRAPLGGLKERKKKERKKDTG